MKRSRRERARGLLWLAALAFLGLACSSGGGDSPTGLTGSSIAEVEVQSLDLANSARSANGIDPQLPFDELVARVARAHSESMRDDGFFGHIGPDGGLVARLNAAGVQFTSAGENLAKVESASNPAGFAHTQFMNSPEHRDVILDPRFRLAGVGAARNGDTYWLTQIYIRR